MNSMKTIDAIEHIAENLVRVTKTSILSGLAHSMDLPVRQGQIDRWLGGELIQDVMPHLSLDQREFLMSGITPDEWDEAFGTANSAPSHLIRDDA